MLLIRLVDLVLHSAGENALHLSGSAPTNEAVLMRAAKKGSRGPSSPRKVAHSASTVQNIVLKYRALLEEEFSEERRKGVKSDFAIVAADTAVSLIEEISAAKDIAYKDRYEAILGVCDSAMDSLFELERTLSDLKWSDRGEAERSINPCEFVARHYYLYGEGLTQDMIRRFDFPLYRALHNRRQNKGWPDWFELPTAAEENSRLLESADTIPSLSEIAAKAPPSIRKLIRLHELARSRGLPKLSNAS
ncbi:hypothetical protein [Devosia sp.]|uniref:hypothetical protein n=1 Tax=Devosia sp. TaxID=1871048 RepID=UPI003A94C55A